jgi:hypothetical protein
MNGKNCYAATFDSYQEMLAHCRKDHPDRPPFGGDPTIELVVTDTQGRRPKRLSPRLRVSSAVCVDKDGADAHNRAEAEPTP